MISIKILFSFKELRKAIKNELIRKIASIGAASVKADVNCSYSLGSKCPSMANFVSESRKLLTLLNFFFLIIWVSKISF